ncbi:Lrp/AsnC family transcriptional regulator [Nonomuraea sp. NPDC050556]|uniref:Lrp/AsnC family transcriptional regulator n=1 Tax=Nonomuraea sp. NPDC050556 TaxID=3364369 RepID=UPI0037B10D66
MDEIDQRLVCALQHNGRLSWGRIAHALGVSERTIARRAGTLLGSGTVRVVAIRNAFRVPGWTPMVLRVRCRPGQVRAVAEALARRSDVLLTDILGGGDEVCATVFSRSPQQRSALLLRDLPATAAVTSWTAYGLLRVFAEALRWEAGLLSAEQLEALGPPYPGPVPGPARPPHPVDERLAELLSTDARMSHAELAAGANISESTARRRVEDLLKDGSVRITADVDVAHLGFGVEAALWLTVRPEAVERVGQALASHPATWFVGATTGPANLLAYVVLPALDDLYLFLGAMPEVAQCETTLFLHAVKRAGVLRR